MLDPAPAKELPDALLQFISWFTPNETEAAFSAFFIPESEADAGPEAAPVLSRMLMSRGPNGVVLKLGSRGSYLTSRDGLSLMVAPLVVEAVDMVAAGDCFNGAFANGLMMSMSPFEAANFASAAAAISVTRAGAQASLPRLHEVQQMHAKARL